MSLLKNVSIIEPYPMGGCNKNDPAAIICTAKGTLQLSSIDGTKLSVQAYYSDQVDGTIISPTTIVVQHKERFVGWLQHANVEANDGTIKLLGRQGVEDIIFKIYMSNDLWYHDRVSLGNNDAKVNRLLNNSATYELWHQRMIHPGKTTMECMHHHAIGVPKLKGNAFYACPSCIPEKLSIKRKYGKNRTQTKRSNDAMDIIQENAQISEPIQDDMQMPEATAGQHFHMDFGFVRGKEFSHKHGDKTVTSIDNKNAYLIVVDRATRYQWTFTTDSKSPPVETIRKLLMKFRSTNPHRTVRVDQGGELGRSKEFLTMISECDFVLETTGSDASSQNGMAERPNRTYGQMMRCILHAAGLGPEFWSYALIYSTYVKNRIYHHSIKSTPYMKFTGTKPDLTNLRIFGSKIFSKKPGKRPYKLDRHSDTGLFLGYTATDRNVIYFDTSTARIKTATYVIFDEAHFTTDAGKAPLAAQTLQRLGYYVKEDYIDDIIQSQQDVHLDLQVQQLTETSTMPVRATPGSIGYDICYDGPDKTIDAGKHMYFNTGIAIQCPTGTYARIAPRSGLTVKNNITTLAGVIDPDYRGEIKVILHNFGHEQQIIKQNQKIAQLILEKAATPETTSVTSLTRTERGQQGFGSTDKVQTRPIHTNVHNKSKNISLPSPRMIPQQQIPFTTSTAAAAKLNADLNIAFDVPYHMHLSTNPYDNHTSRDIFIKSTDKDPTLGMVIEMCPKRNLPRLIECKKGSSSIRIQRWKRELRNGYITTVNGQAIKTIQDIILSIHNARTSKAKSVNIGFSTMNKQAIQPQYGIPQLYHDQMNIIGKHLWDMKHGINTENNEVEIPFIQETILRKITKNAKKIGKNKLWTMITKLPRWRVLKALKSRKLTRRILKERSDWLDWKKSEFKQLDQYKAQGTFGQHQQLPTNANVLPLIWTYLIKDCGTKKARCCCNGSPKMKGTVTLGETYAGSLDQTGARIFWAATAINNFITIGADASNAFAEAPPPKEPLFVTIDQQYRDWYHERYPDEPPIPKNYVLPVKGALQGHPESPRLWAQLIDRIILELNLKPCTHEPCLYYTNNYNNTGKTVLFLRQVDDFAVSVQDVETAKQVIEDINSKMTINVKQLGQLERFNGMDVTQTKHYIKLSNKTYINKFLQRHEWIHTENRPMHQFPIPMNADNNYQKRLEQAPIPTEEEIQALEKEMGFGYRQAIGELIYAMVTCRADISHATIKLSQYSTRPTRIHFEAIKDIMRYLLHTIDDGIYYWRKEPRNDLPYENPPTMKNDNNYNETEIHERQQNDHNTLFGAVDSDFAGDTTHRRSVSGIVLRLAGGTIFYKTKYQETVAQSSTEAEFMAASEAGKYILYIRTILKEIGLPQQMATVLYEDNQGALLMANAQQPTKRTRHVETRHFAIQEWVERDLLTLLRIATNDNYSDVLTKATGRILFYRHMNYIMGKIRPSYVQFEPP
jgi:deoxyuridine 5'-triphosphate nucleotidohydrolase